MDQIDLFKDWAAAQTVTLTAAVIAVLGVAATILTTANRTRREHRASLYADAHSAVGNYLEGPYRIRRKDGTPAHRNTISAGLSDVKAAIDHSQTLLRLHAPPGVADAYDDYVDAAKREARATDERCLDRPTDLPGQRGQPPHRVRPNPVRPVSPAGRGRDAGRPVAPLVEADPPLRPLGRSSARTTSAAAGKQRGAGPATPTGDHGSGRC